MLIGPAKFIEWIILAAIVACITLAAGAIDMRDSMAKCQERYSFSTCHAALNR